MSAVSIDKFFRIFNFLKDNPYNTTAKNFQQESNLIEISYNLYKKVLKFDSLNNLSLTKDINIINTALQARYGTRRFITRTMIPGSYAFNTKDMDLYRNLLVDWASTIKTEKDMMMHASDAFSLDDDDIDKAIRGFGINWVNKKSVPKLMTAQRALFLYAMCELYKIKGSPVSITRALQYMGISNAIIKEHWVEPVPYTTDQLQIRAVATSKNLQEFNPEKNRYESFYKGSADDVIIPWDSFMDKMQEIAEPHWWYKHDEIVDLNNDPDIWLKLPSITPYFGIVSYNDLNKYNLAVSFIEKILSDQFNQYLRGDKDFLPQDIGLDGFNQELTQRKIQIDGFNEPLTLIETYLAWAYCQIRYDEYVAWKRLYDFMTKHQVKLDMPYTYPWAYPELILYLWENKDTTVFGPVDVDIILRQYPGDLSHYYLNNNELHYWWSVVKGNGDTDLPEIFTSNKYNFRYSNEVLDTTYDKILHYNGNRSLDYRKSTFEYEEAIGDFERNCNQILVRGTDYNINKSFYENNHPLKNNTLYNSFVYDNLATYYRNISWYTECDENGENGYRELVEHDGSKLTPRYIAKWPETKSWNWAVDKYFYYMSYTPVDWCRWAVERQWDKTEGSYCRPNESNLSGSASLGTTVYQEQYVYCNISDHQWVRWVVETEWNYCDGPIRPSGAFRQDNNFAKQFIVGQVSLEHASKYLRGKMEQGLDRINVTVDPYEINEASRSITLSVNEFDAYLKVIDAHVDEAGNLIKNVKHFKHGQHIYSYVYDVITRSNRWVRKPCETNWNYNGPKSYIGTYHYPNLDLTNRYDAERILRGVAVLNVSELTSLSNETIVDYFDTNGSNKILVNQDDTGNPAVYYFKGWNGQWSEGTSYEESDIVYYISNNAYGFYYCKESGAYDIEDTTKWENLNDVSTFWKKETSASELANIKLGFNSNLMDWIDNVRCTEEKNYGELADEILAISSNYISIQFQDSELNVAGIYKDISNNGLYHDAIEFYKPKRARLLYFSVEFSINTRYDNSLFLEDIPSNTKIIHEIQDHVPHNDLIYLNTTKYDKDGKLVKQETYLTDSDHYKETRPSSSIGDYYINGCPIEAVNGFYKKLVTQQSGVVSVPYAPNFTNGSAYIIQGNTKVLGKIVIDNSGEITSATVTFNNATGFTDSEPVIVQQRSHTTHGFLDLTASSESDFWVNDHNIVIQKIYNQNTIWEGKYFAEWIIARRNVNGLSRCDALYLNYINNDTDNLNAPSTSQKWFSKKADPDNEEPESWWPISINDVTLDILRPQDKIQTITPLNPTSEILGEVSWENILNDKSRNDKENLFKKSLVFHNGINITDPAYCVDEIRPMWPNSGKYIALPENIEGGKLAVSGNDFDQSYEIKNNGIVVDKDKHNTEYRHSYRDRYPYIDDMKDHLIVEDGCDNSCENPGHRELTNYFQAKADYPTPPIDSGKPGAVQGLTLQPGHFIVSKFNSSVSEYIAHEIQTLSKNCAASVDVYIGTTCISNTQYTIDIKSGKIQFDFGDTTPNYSGYIKIVKYDYPEWYINNEHSYYQGPNHRPAYMGIKSAEDDMYPCHDWSDCCDYYDTGCRHDGPTNPHTEIWHPTLNQWIECETSEGNTIDHDLDVWTRFHKAVGYISKKNTDLYNYYLNEVTKGRKLENPGDTYCNECGHPAESPDQSTREVPSYLKNTGIYHDKLFHTSKIKGNKYTNLDSVSYWTPWITKRVGDEDVTFPYEVRVGKREKNNFFKYGYISDDGNYQIRHAFDLNTATHLWQVTTVTAEGVAPRVMYKSKPKKLKHEESEIIGQLTDWISSPKDFIEGTEFDIAEDTLLDASGNETSLIFTNNIFFRLAITNGTTVGLRTPEHYWEMQYVKVNEDYGNVFIYTPNGWKKITNKAYLVDPADQYGPKDEYNYFGYWFVKKRSKYDLYLKVEGYGWAVIHNVASSAGPNNYKDYYNNDWILSGSVIYKISHMDIQDAEPELNSDTHVCADPIPYAETYDGVYLASKAKKRHTCTVREKVFIDTLVDYCETIARSDIDDNGAYYRKIFISTPSTEEPTKYTDLKFIKINSDDADDDTVLQNYNPNYQFCDSSVYKITDSGYDKVIENYDTTFVKNLVTPGSYYKFELM